MPYKHFGNIGDIWKHLPLCEVLHVEKPDSYIESNSAFPTYSLTKSPEKEYGIYHFFEMAVKHNILSESQYFKQIKKYNKERLLHYLGSPALAINMLHYSANQFEFYDLEAEPLTEIEQYAKIFSSNNKISTHNTDSIKALIEKIDSFTANDFLFIDPYYIDQQNNSGQTFMALTAKAINKGIKTFLWYGFVTINQKNHLNTYIKEKLSGIKTNSIFNAEIILDCIQENDIVVNPGILGCGVLIANCSKKSIKIVEKQLNCLVDIYKGKTYNGQNAELKSSIINLV